MVDSVAAYVDGLDRQAELVREFSAPDPIPRPERDRAVFAGSGDSLAAAMLAEALSDRSVRAADPLELCNNPATLDGRSLYVVSVSGRTAANVMLARRFSCTAITADARSELARAARRIIPTPFPQPQTLTAGGIGFLASALTCMALAGATMPSDVNAIYDRARRDARAAGDYGGRLFLLGDMHTFPIAMYGAAKTYEILGRPASYSRMEQFAHMELFGAKPADTVVVLGKADRRAKTLADSLRSEGIACMVTDPRLERLVDCILYRAFYVQALPLNGIGSNREVHFVRAAGLKRISDSLIY